MCYFRLFVNIFKWLKREKVLSLIDQVNILLEEKKNYFVMAEQHTALERALVCKLYRDIYAHTYKIYIWVYNLYI